MNRIAILGASRGLGWALYSELVETNKEISFFLSSRKINEKVKTLYENTKLKTQLIPQDFSKTPVDPHFVKILEQFRPTILVYVAGGGPYGEFQTKKWSDHIWALNTTFIYPAELLHHILASPQSWISLQKIIFVGSAVAEQSPDPNAASYAAAKHALKGLVSSIQQESVKSPKIELFSPGYMQTELLPGNSWPVAQGLVESPNTVAQKLITLIEKNNQR